MANFTESVMFHIEILLKCYKILQNSTKSKKPNLVPLNNAHLCDSEVRLKGLWYNVLGHIKMHFSLPMVFLKASYLRQNLNFT